jgi:thiol:disulfide interchange protein DsbD
MGPLAALSPAVLLAVGQLPRAGEPPRAEDLVRPSLVAERVAIAPGERMLLGVRLALEPGWHVYWTNPGDSGFPTTATLAAPAGFEVGPLRYPGPRRFQSPGEITSYGWADEVLLVAEVRAPEDLAPGSSARFSVEGRWLVCADVCLPGSGRAELALPVVAQGPAAQAERALFARWLPRLPRPAGELLGLATRWIPGEQDALEIALRGATELELFPAAHPVVELAAQELLASEGGARLVTRWRVRRAPFDGPLVAAGLLRVVDEEGERFHELSAPFAGAAADRSGRSADR